MTTAAFVFDAALSSFEQDVILKSKEVPVLVDFWASWCEPCKALGPILEKLAAEFNGGFLLAKVDVDKEQQLAGYFQVKSIPTVMLLKNGQIVDGFPGALPENQLREFLKHHEIVAKEAMPETEEEAAAYDAWFRAKVAASLADPRPSVPHEEVVARLAASREKRRNAARRLA